MRPTSRHFAEFWNPGLADAGTVNVAFTITAVETPGIGSLGTLNLALTPSTTYEGLNSEFGTLTLAFTPSATFVQGYADAEQINYKFTPSGVEAPQYIPVEAATIPLKLTPSTTYEVQAREYDDGGSIRLSLSPTSHECFNHPTPLYDFSLDKRWQIPAVEGRWDVNVFEKRWNVFLIGEEAFDNSCP